MATKPSAAESAAPTPMTAEQAASAAERRLADRLGAGFDPATLLAILTAILQALGVCKSQGPAAIKKAAEKRNALTELRLRRALRQEGIRPLSDEMSEAVDAAFALGAEATTDEIAALCNCCE